MWQRSTVTQIYVTHTPPVSQEQMYKHLEYILLFATTTREILLSRNMLIFFCVYLTVNIYICSTYNKINDFVPAFFRGSFNEFNILINTIYRC